MPSPPRSHLRPRVCNRPQHALFYGRLAARIGTEPEAPSPALRDCLVQRHYLRGFATPKRGYRKVRALIRGIAIPNGSASASKGAEIVEGGTIHDCRPAFPSRFLLFSDFFWTPGPQSAERNHSRRLGAICIINIRDPREAAPTSSNSPTSSTLCVSSVWPAHALRPTRSTAQRCATVRPTPVQRPPATKRWSQKSGSVAQKAED